MRTNFYPILINRRNFIKLGLGGVGALLMNNCKPSKTSSVANIKRLVVLEMNGANDGLNTVIPYGIGNYYDLRKRIAIKESKVLPIDSKWGFHPALPLLSNRYKTNQVAIFQGVGHPTKPDLSHFAMMDIWRSGRLEGSRQKDKTGWLGRMLDLIAAPAVPLAGFSIATSVNSSLFGKNDKTAAAEEKDRLYLPDGLEETFRDCIKAMTAVDKSDPAILASARQGLQNSIPIADFLYSIRKIDQAYSGTDTGYALAFAARILAVNDWIRVIHIPLPLDFDTHVEQLARQKANLSEIDAALDGFLNDLEALGLADQTLVLTTSEFGRRASDNGSDGTDHGTANSLFVIGKHIKGGLYGEPPSLTSLNKDGNLKATFSFQDLLATVAEGWMGIPASEVVPGGKLQNIFK